MSSNVLTAIAREKQPGRFKETGFVAGVLYGKTIESAAVKFDEEAIISLFAKQGNAAKVTVEFAGVTLNGFVKESQRSVMTQKISHIDIQIIG